MQFVILHCDWLYAMLKIGYLDYNTILQQQELKPSHRPLISKASDTKTVISVSGHLNVLGKFKAVIR